MDPQNPMCGMAYDDLGNRIPKMTAATPKTAPRCTCMAASPRGSAMVPRTSGSPLPVRPQPIPQGVSVVPVPDMSDSGAANDGAMTFYYTNQQAPA